MQSLFEFLVRLRSGRVEVSSADHPRFLLIKSWGYGFWSDMNHVFGCLLLAEITGRIPVTHWGQNSLFTDTGQSDAFRLYFEEVSPFSLEDLQSIPGISYFPAKWSRNSLPDDNHAKWEGAGSRLSGGYYLHRREEIAVSDFYIHLPDLLSALPLAHALHGRSVGEVYRALAEKYLRLRPHILAEIEAFHREHIANYAPIIAVHVRGTDKFREPDYKVTLQSYFDVVDAVATHWKIFLLTDQAQCVEAFRSRYGSRVIFTNAHRSSNRTAVHHDRAADHVRLGVEIIKDTYLALRCQKFVGHGLSNPACIVSVLKDWPEGDCVLFEPSLLRRKFSQRMRRRRKKSGFSKVIDTVFKRSGAPKPADSKTR